MKLPYSSSTSQRLAGASPEPETRRTSQRRRETERSKGNAGQQKYNSRKHKKDRSLPLTPMLSAAVLAGIAENDGELWRREEKTKEKWKIESEKEEKLGFWGQIAGHRRSHRRKNENSGGGRREIVG